jgi:hypothetical protein
MPPSNQIFYLAIQDFIGEKVGMKDCVQPK